MKVNFVNMKDNGDNYMNKGWFKILKWAEIIIRRDIYKQRLGLNCLCYYDKSNNNFALKFFSEYWLISFLFKNFQNIKKPRATSCNWLKSTKDIQWIPKF